MSRRPSTLRVRLALIGLAGILVPLVVLVAVSMVSNETTRTTGDGDATVTQRTRELSPWVPATAAALAVPAALLAWWWAGRAVGPLRRVTAVADEIQLTSLDRRIGQMGAPEEVTLLAASFDRMLDRLDVATTAERRFVEDVSHQLRTPLAVLSMSADVALAKPRPTVEQLTDVIRSTKQITAQLTAIVDDLLVTARTEQQVTRQVDTDLVSIAADVKDACSASAAVGSVEIVLNAPTACIAAVDGPSVRRAVTCLVENAIRLNPPGGTVTIEVGSTSDRRHFVAVTDEGPGVQPVDQAQIFERYWSGDAERVGLGIGLAIVKHVAEANDGIEIASPVTSAGGTTFTMFFRAGPPGVAPRAGDRHER
jgi:signal transduction histidine kinase